MDGRMDDGWLVTGRRGQRRPKAEGGKEETSLHNRYFGSQLRSESCKRAIRKIQKMDISMGQKSHIAWLS